MAAGFHVGPATRVTPETVGASPTPAEGLPVRGRALKLLLVDDDECTAILFRLVLQKAGWQVRLQVVEGGQEAINYLAGKGAYGDRSTYPVPDLIILDLIMPGVTGLDVLDWRRMSPELSAIPVVVFSGTLQEKDRQDALAKGAARFIAKPSDSAAFKNAIEEMVRFGEQARPQ